MDWNETRKKLMQLATRRADRRATDSSGWSSGPDGPRIERPPPPGPVPIRGSVARVAPRAPGALGALGAPGRSERPTGDERLGRAVRASSLCIASGKGGTGKSCVTASLAALLAPRGRTLIVDADLGVGNAHILQDVSPPRTLVDVVEGTASMREVAVKCGGQIDLLAGGSGVPRMSELSNYELHLVASGLEELELDYRFVLVDSAAGVSRQTVAFAAACDRTLIVTTPDLTAMTDAYALTKVLLTRIDEPPLLLVNRARDEEQAKEVEERILRVCSRFLGRTPVPIGWVPDDPLVGECANRRGAVAELEPDAPASYQLRQRAVRILDELVSRHPGGFGRRLLENVGYSKRLA